MACSVGYAVGTYGGNQVNEAIQFLSMVGFFGLFCWSYNEWNKSTERCRELEQTIRSLKEAAAMRSETNENT